MKTKEQILEAIIKQGMLPLFYHDTKTTSIETVRTLYRAGVRVIEYTNRGSQAFENFKAIKSIMGDEMPDLSLGIGTIKQAKDALSFIEAGADFLVSPIVKAEVGEAVNKANLLWIPGCMTPTEIDVAQYHKALLIKLFPANILGPGYVSAIKELFPGQLFMPTGGVELDHDNLQQWFSSGVGAVGFGSKLITKDILKNESYEELYNLTIKALQMIAAARESITINL